MKDRKSRPRIGSLLPAGRFEPEAGAEPFPGYKLARLRGRGGFATVWESSTPAGERVALKFMSSQNSSSTAREIRSLQAIHRLTHPNLLRTRDVWSVSGQIVIGMDLADASLLDLFLLYADELGRPIEVEKVLLYLYQAADALDYLNARQHNFDGKLVGFQHGDIKPNNILLIGDTPYLADYGLATPTLGPVTPCSRQGTLEYAAPEVFQGTLTDTSDQFALGVTYALLRGGSFPFPPPPASPGKSFLRPPPHLDFLPADERPVVARALAFVPQSRYPSCLAFVRELLRVNNLEAVRDPARGLLVQSLNRSQLLRMIVSRVTAADADTRPS